MANDKNFVVKNGIQVGTTFVANDTVLGALSGASLTNLTAGNLSGTIPSGVLGNSKLSVHASTTSDELATVISDETGSGSLVFGTGPTLSAPIISGNTAFDTNTLFVDSVNDKVGVGTTAPKLGLHLALSTANSFNNIGITEVDWLSGFRSVELGYYGVGNTGTLWGITNSNLGQLKFQNMSNALIGTNGSAPLIFATLSLERMRIAGNGNVGIGTTTPGSLLTLAGSGPQIYFSDTAVGGKNWIIGPQAGTGDANQFGIYGNGGNILQYNGSANSMALYSNGSVRMYIAANGNVGIGNTTPAQKLVVSGDTYLTGNVGIGAAPSTAGLYSFKNWAADATLNNTNITTYDSNTTITVAREKAGINSSLINLNQNKSADGLTTYASTYIGGSSYVYNGNPTSGGDAQSAAMYGHIARTYNYANGANANTIAAAYGINGGVYQYGSGIISNAFGSVNQVIAGNNSVTGAITTGFGVYSTITSNTAMTIGTGYLYYGQHNGSTTTTKYGIYLTGEANNYFSGNVSVGGDAIITGNLTVNGTTTTINSTTISVDDKNIELGSVASPTNTTADGGGITLKGATDKTFNWVNATTAWTSSENMDLVTGKQYTINNVLVANSSTLGSGITTSSLTQVGTIGTGVWQGTVIGGTYGGTGVNNGAKTITIGGNISTANTFTTSGNYALTLTQTGATSLTLPTSGTVVSLDALNNFTANTITANLTGTSSSSNNASYLGGTAASGYQTTVGLSANVATLTANNSTNAFGKTEGAINANSATYFGGNYTWAAPAALGGTTANSGQFTTLTLTTNTATIGTAAYHVANGNFGIGTSSPAAKLDIRTPAGTAANQYIVTGSSAAAATLQFGQTGAIGWNTGITATDGYYQIGIDTGGVGYTINRSGTAISAHSWLTSGTEAMRIVANGNVGIGTTSPTQKLVVSGDTYLTGNVGIGIAPSSSVALFSSKTWASDASLWNTKIDTTDSNTAMTASQNKFGLGMTFTNLNQNKSSDGLTTYNPGLYGNIITMINGNTATGGDAYGNFMTAVDGRVQNFANGSTSNTIATALPINGTTYQYGSGIITNAYGVKGTVIAGNNSVTGNVTTAYGVSSTIISNTAMTIGTGYLYHGAHSGATTTTKYGIYLTGETTNYFSGNTGIGNTAPTHKLSVNGTSFFGGAITFANNNTFTANGSVGSAGQVLTSNTTGVYWSTISANLGLAQNTSTVTVTSSIGTNSVITAATGSAAGVLTAEAQTIAGTKTFNSNVVLSTATSLSANGTVGSAGQALISNATTAYWGTLPVAGGGTGQASALTQYGVIYSSNSTTMATSAAGTSAQVLHGNASGAPTWGAVSLTTDVSGILPVANGGTGVGTSTGTGSNVLSAAPAFTGNTTFNTTTLAIDSLNNRVGVGTTTPSVTLDVVGNIKDTLGLVRAAPIQTKSGAYAVVTADAGSTIYISTGGVTFNVSTLAAGDMVTIVNNSASSQTITAAASVTFRLAGTATTGARTLAQYGMATFLCVVGGATPTYICSGAGLT